MRNGLILLLGSIAALASAGCGGRGGGGPDIQVIEGALVQTDAMTTDGCYCDTYLATAESTGDATILMASPEVDSALFVITPGGIPMGGGDTQTGFLDETCTFTAVKGQSYVIMALGQPSQCGCYTLTFSSELRDIHEAQMEGGAVSGFLEKHDARKHK